MHGLFVLIIILDRTFYVSVIAVTVCECHTELKGYLTWLDYTWARVCCICEKRGAELDYLWLL